MRKPSFCRDFCEDAARLKITSRRILKKFNYTTPPLVSNNPPYATFLFLSAAQADTAEIKDRIQALLRAIVIARDGGCILRDVRHCNGLPNIPGVVLQADHLITRTNSATFADTRLVVCVCRPCHGWKSLGGNQRKAQYDALVRTLLPPDRVALWDRCEQDSWRPHRTFMSDWRLAEVVLKGELYDPRGDRNRNHEPTVVPSNSA